MKLEMHAMLTLPLASLVLALPTAILADPVLRDTTNAVRTAGYDIVDKDVIDVRFDRGSSTLSETQKDQLRSFVNAFRSDGSIFETVVIAFSDKDYVRGQKSDLPKGDRDLADKRAQVTKDYLDRVGAKSISTYNMAERPNWFERTMVTSDARIKGDRNARPPVTTSRDDVFYDALGRRLVKTGQAGKVVVVMRHDPANSTAH